MKNNCTSISVGNDTFPHAKVHDLLTLSAVLGMCVSLALEAMKRYQRDTNSISANSALNLKWGFS